MDYRPTLVGFMVHYYTGADKKNEPLAALVLRDYMTGVFTLEIFPLQGGDPVFRKSVHHISDVWFRTYPQSAIADGAWDFIPGVQYPVSATNLSPPKEAAIKASFDAIPVDTQKIIIGLVRAGNGISDIARKFAPKGISRATIESFVAQEIVNV